MGIAYDEDENIYCHENHGIVRHIVIVVCTSLS